MGILSYTYQTYGEEAEREAFSNVSAAGDL